MSEELDDAVGGGGDEAWESESHLAYVLGVEAVDVLVWVDCLDDLLFGDVAWEWELDDEAVDVVVVVEFLDLGEELVFGDVVFVADEGGGESTFLTCFDFVGYIGLAASVVSDEDGCKVWAFAALGDDCLYFLSYAEFDFGCRLLSVD